MPRDRDEDDDIDADPDERYRRRGRRYYDDDPDNVDRDTDEEYRRRVRRYGAETTNAEEEQEERDEAESERVARRKCLGPGLLLILAGVLGIAADAVYAVVTMPAAGGAGPGAAVATMGYAFTTVIPGVIALVFLMFQIIGGVCLVRRRVRGIAVTGAILGAFPGAFGAFVGLLASQWGLVAGAIALVALSGSAAIWMFVAFQDDDVQAAFEQSNRYG
jgi:hypothetical protein